MTDTLNDCGQEEAKRCQCKSLPSLVYTAFLRDEQIGLFPVFGGVYAYRPLTDGGALIALWQATETGFLEEMRVPDILVRGADFELHFERLQRETA